MHASVVKDTPQLPMRRWQLLVNRRSAGPHAQPTGLLARPAVSPPRSAVVPHRSAGSPPRPSVIPHRSAVVPHRSAVSPPRPSVIPHRSAVIPHRSAVPRAGSSVVPHRPSVVPLRLSVVPPRLSVIHGSPATLWGRKTEGRLSDSAVLRLRRCVRCDASGRSSPIGLVLRMIIWLLRPDCATTAAGVSKPARHALRPIQLV
jgi:hypothetical protein